jgi:hypothetical protein
MRFGKGLAELLIYVAGGAAAVGVTVWAAIVIF